MVQTICRGCPEKFVLRRSQVRRASVNQTFSRPTLRESLIIQGTSLGKFSRQSLRFLLWRLGLNSEDYKARIKTVKIIRPRLTLGLSLEKLYAVSPTRSSLEDHGLLTDFIAFLV